MPYRGSTSCRVPPLGREALLKLSVRCSAGQGGVDPDVVRGIAWEIAAAVREGFQAAVVVGGGNFFRGAELQQKGMDRSRADYIGMLGTVTTCLALEGLPGKGGHRHPVRARSRWGRWPNPTSMRRHPRPREGPGGHLRRRRGDAALSTDTPSAQRALERKRDVVLMSKSASTVSTTPSRAPTLTRESGTGELEDALRSGLRVVDAAAFSLRMDKKLPMVVFGMEGDGNITGALLGERIGTLVSA